MNEFQSPFNQRRQNKQELCLYTLICYFKLPFFSLFFTFLSHCLTVQQATKKTELAFYTKEPNRFIQKLNNNSNSNGGQTAAFKVAELFISDTKQIQLKHINKATFLRKSTHAPPNNKKINKTPIYLLLICEKLCATACHELLQRICVIKPNGWLAIWISTPRVIFHCFLSHALQVCAIKTMIFGSLHCA